MKIGELAKLTDCSVQAIRFYEKEQLIKPKSRSEGNYRLYDKLAFDQLVFIKHCRKLDITLAEIKKLLELHQFPEKRCEAVMHLIDQHISQIDTRINDLNTLKLSLNQLKTQCDSDQTIQECGILKDLSTK